MTEKEARDYIDSYLSHIIGMVEYGNLFASEIKDMVEACRQDLDAVLSDYKISRTKTVCKKIEKEISERLERLAADMNEYILEQIEEVIETETEWLDDNVAAPLDIDFSYSDRFKGLLLSLPFLTAGVLSEYGKTVSDRLEGLYHQKVMQSYVSSSLFEDLDQMYESRFNSFFRGLQSETETIGTDMSSQFDRMVYTKNDKKIGGYVWIATLDTTTCMACGLMSGTKFKSMSEVPYFPLHQNCRCQCIPVTEEIEDSIPESYSEWFEEQSDKDKYKILGKTRFQLYEEGMKIKSFVNNGKLTPLKDLKK